MSSRPLRRLWRRDSSTSNAQRKSLSVGDAAGVQIDGQLVAPLAGLLKKLLDLVLAQLDRQHAVLEAVVVEDVGEARRDDGPEAVILDRPDGVLAAGAAAEVPAGQQDRRALGFGLVELELRDWAFCRRRVAPVEEQELARSRSARSA